ncbi:KilA-N domain-containing protein [Leptolyngbyaceae cyanobacterium UHCC 1019]
MSEMIVREFNGVAIPQRESDGYFNLTAMCKTYGKKVNDWVRLKSTQSFLEALSATINSEALPSRITLIESRKGKSKNFEQATYGHYQAALELARWLDVGFAIATNEWIKDWMEGKHQPQIEQPLRFMPTTPIVRQPLDSVLKQVEKAEEVMVRIRNSPDLAQADKRLLINRVRSGLR